MIEVVGLTKKYGSNLAVDNISFSIQKGEIVGFLGPNGAGKSTTMNIITGYLSATSGSVKINGYDVLDDPIEARKCIGYLPEQPPLYLDMTVNEYLRFVYNLKKVSHKGREVHISEVCRLVGIEHVRNRIVGNLSKGYKQRVGLAQALIGDPEVLILDEPTVGLDPNQIIEIRNMIRTLGKERTIILSTHILPEVNAVCERVLMINAGKIVANDTTENITETTAAGKQYLVRVEGPQSAVLAVLNNMEGITSAKVQKEGEPGAFDYLIQTDNESDIRKTLVLALAKQEFAVLSFQAVGTSLEDVFSELTKNDKKGDA
ncbi:MAG: ATP-binding cassette domain-containing protein [Oscillospiraceae bacterium]|nr:ATP-binding cassette domain-containing protein [Oscillospiraceae bacterium]